MKTIFGLLFLLASVAAQFEDDNFFIPILSYSNENNDDGSYQYSYETGNGISVQEEGFVKNLGEEGLEAQTARGRYSYIAPDGQLITVTWYADETGFHAEGSHIPRVGGQPPVASEPPVPQTEEQPALEEPEFLPPPPPSPSSYDEEMYGDPTE